MDDGTTIEFLGILTCILASALFSASETAITSLSRSKIEQLLENGVTSSLLKLWLRRPNQVLSTILIGNNIVNILASSLATDLSHDLLMQAGYGATEGAGIALAVGVMTLLILIFGEVVPKTIANQYPEKLFPIFRISFLLFYLAWPFSKGLVLISRFIVWLGGGKLKSHEGPLVTGEDLEFMIRRGTEEKSLDEGVGKILAGALDLEDTQAKEIMVPRTDMVMFDTEDTLEDAWSEIQESQFSRYPIYEETPDQVVGIVYVKDLLNHLKDGKGNFLLSDTMRSDIYFIPETKTVDELLAELKQRKISMGIVVDEYGGTAGMITMEDILEEMVGEIYDEYDEDEPPLVQTHPHTYRVKALFPLEDLEDALPLRIRFPEDADYETVGGLLMDLSGKVPAPGEVILWPDPEEGLEENAILAFEPNDLVDESYDIPPVLRFTVLSATETRIDNVRLEILNHPDALVATKEEIPPED